MIYQTRELSHPVLLFQGRLCWFLGGFHGSSCLLDMLAIVFFIVCPAKPTRSRSLDWSKVGGNKWVLSYNRLKIKRGNIWGCARQLAGLIPLHIFVLMSQKHFSWNLVASVLRIVYEVALFWTCASLGAMVHSAGDGFVVFGLLQLRLSHRHEHRRRLEAEGVHYADIRLNMRLCL